MKAEITKRSIYPFYAEKRMAKIYFYFVSTVLGKFVLKDKPLCLYVFCLFVYISFCESLESHLHTDLTVNMIFMKFSEAIFSQ